MEVRQNKTQCCVLCNPRIAEYKNTKENGVNSI